MTEISNDSITVSLLPKHASVHAIVIGIEQYQNKSSGQMPKTHYAAADATAFGECIKRIFADHDPSVHMFVDSDATKTTIENEISSTLYQLGPDDLFVFYYAGHGFHTGNENIITMWDTHVHHIENTSLELRSALYNPLKDSDCNRSLMFIDACAVGIPEFESRDVLSNMSSEQLKEFISLTEYAGIFLACQPGQKSYGHGALGHGVWTYHLIQALNGENDDAVGVDGYITDVSLKNHLALCVPRYVTKHMSGKKNQKPSAEISASNTFGICKFIEQTPKTSATNDFTAIGFDPDRKYFSGADTRDYDRLPGFNKRKGHFIPEDVNDNSAAHARSLLEEEISDEIDSAYQEIKTELRLKRADIQQGEDSLDTEYFRFWIDVRQNPRDPSEIFVERNLIVRECDQATFEKISHTFGAIFDRFVCDVRSSFPDYDDTVDLLEEIAEANGDEVYESSNQQIVEYKMDEGVKLLFDFLDQTISVVSPAQDELLELSLLPQKIALGRPEEPISYIERDDD